MARSARAIIDLDALAHNARALKSLVPEGCRLMAVIKDDAYGHGVIPCARALLERGGADFLAVSIPEEGFTLREGGIEAPILIMGASPLSSVEDIVRWDLRATVFEPQLLCALQKTAQEMGKTAKVHLKIDSGMRRLGVASEEELRALFAVWKDCPNVEMEGVFAHFANADAEERDFVDEQKERFLKAVALAKEFAGDNVLVHHANTAGTLNIHDCHFDMVRCGIGLYGYYPSDTTSRAAELRPVMRWETEVTRVFTIEKGETVGYGRTYTAPSTRRIATVPIGYGDGYHRHMTHKAHVLIHGYRVPIVGRICMDQCMADVTDIPDEVKIGDEIVLMGKQGDQEIDADDLAEWGETISYEVVLSVNWRVPRIHR